MARRLPPLAEGNPFAHPALSLPLLVTWIVASIAIVASLCGSCHRKPATKSPPSSPTAQSIGSKATKPEPATTSTEVQEQEQEDDGEDQSPPSSSDERITELDAAIHGPIYPASNLPSGSTSKRRLSVSLSVGLKEGLSRIKTKKESASKGGGEESLWKKTIILGEKCKMMNGDEEGEGNGMELNQDTMSRNTSFASAEAGRFSTSV